MNKTNEIIVAPLGHIHKDWFEIDKTKDGTIIGCPSGCRRYLKKNGKIEHWDEREGQWIKGL